jgi:lysine 2,3-aminomutase
VAASAQKNRAGPLPPVPFRPVGDEYGLLLATPFPLLAANDKEPVWVRRARALFDPAAAGVIADYFTHPQTCVELRLCGGPVSAADWEMWTTLAERVRIADPECVLRIELWCDAGVPVEPAPDVLARLRALRPLFVQPWLEREADLTSAVQISWARFLDAGIPMGAEVLLRRAKSGGGGTNDETNTVSTLRSLCLKLVEWRVRPQMLVDGAWLAADERVPIDSALDYVRGLRGWISGLAVPQLVEESPSGVRTVRIPPYVVGLDESGADLVSYAGRRHRYPNPPEE